MTCAGTIRRLSRLGASVTLVLLTAGERGNPQAMLDQGLREIRIKEAQRASTMLGVDRLIQQDFGDGQLTLRLAEVSAWLAGALHAQPCDLLITYDPSGLDGHPDHVACSQAVTEVHLARSVKPTLWYVAIPPWLLRLLQRGGQMRRDPSLEARRAMPTHRTFVGGSSMTRMGVLRSYRSQRDAIGKGLGRLVPPWLAVGLLPFEYFSQAD